MRLNRTMQFAVSFHRFASEYGIPGHELGQMIAHSRASAAAYARNDNKAHLAHMASTEEVGSRYGCKVDWPGLWPVIAKQGCGESMLPCHD